MTVFKVVKIIAKVVFILCIVGAAGCLLSLCMLPLVGKLIPPQVLADEGLTLGAAYMACATGLVACVGEIVFAFMAERYFGHVLTAGTPFTLDGAKESFRLGIASIIISAATAVIFGIISGIFAIFSEGLADVDVNASISLSTGLFFLFISMVFKYGAELKEDNTENKNI